MVFEQNLDNPIRVSIALATFNAERYIGEQLRSIENQSLLPDEIIFLDDGSSDDTLNILRLFKEESLIPCTIHINTRNHHFTGNFLKAASLCQGDIIAFCDQDDIWHPTKLEICVRQFKSDRSDLLVHEGRVIDEGGRFINKKIPDLRNVEAWHEKPPFDRQSKGFAMLVSKRLVNDFLFYWNWDDYFEFRNKFGPPLGHDLLLYAFSLNEYKVSFLKKELVYYRIHGSNVTANVAVTKNVFDKTRHYVLNLNFDYNHYQHQAEKWASEVDFLSRYLSRAKDKMRYKGMHLLKGWLQRRSALYLVRAKIYKKNGKLLDRVIALIELYKMGGYDSNKAGAWGWRSMLKDVFIVIFN